MAIYGQLVLKGSKTIPIWNYKMIDLLTFSLNFVRFRYYCALSNMFVIHKHSFYLTGKVSNILVEYTDLMAK